MWACELIVTEINNHYEPLDNRPTRRYNLKKQSSWTV
jgi:hypothetical protein